LEARHDGRDETSGVSLGAQFLGAFNEIEGHFRDSLQCEDYVQFADLVRTYADRHRLPKEHVKALSVFAALRNAISHQNYYGGRPIASHCASRVARSAWIARHRLSGTLSLASDRICP